jgi:hypothetical protein
MNCTVELESASSGEGTNRAFTLAVDLHILDLRCARLSGRLRRATRPRRIRDHMRRQRVIDRRDAVFLSSMSALPSANGQSWTRDVEAHCIGNQGQQRAQSHHQRTGRLSRVHKSHPAQCCENEAYTPDE